MEYTRKIINISAGEYLTEQEAGDLYDAYIKLRTGTASKHDPAQYEVDVWDAISDISVGDLIMLIEDGAKKLIPEPLRNIDWRSLKDQKLQLLEDAEENNLDVSGIIHLIDSLQDYVVDACGLEEKEVFNLTDKE